MNHRGQWGWAWGPEDSPTTKAGKALARYPGHFGPGFLFQQGDENFDWNPAQAGAFGWYMLPLLLAGLGAAVRRGRRSGASRTLLLWLAVFPLCDVMLTHPPRESVSAMRSSPGLAAFVLLGAIGAEEVWRWLRAQSMRQAAGVAAVGVCATIALTGRFAHQYFRQMPSNRDTWVHQRLDVLDAAQYLRGRAGDVDAVLILPNNLFLPYIYFVVGLPFDVQEWFGGPREFAGDPVQAVRFGKFALRLPEEDPCLRRPAGARRILVVCCQARLGAEWSPVYVGRLPDGEGLTHVYEMSVEDLRRLN